MEQHGVQISQARVNCQHSSTKLLKSFIIEFCFQISSSPGAFKRVLGLICIHSLQSIKPGGLNNFNEMKNKRYMSLQQKHATRRRSNHTNILSKVEIWCYISKCIPNHLCSTNHKTDLSLLQSFHSSQKIRQLPSDECNNFIARLSNELNGFCIVRNEVNLPIQRIVSFLQTKRNVDSRGKCNPRIVLLRLTVIQSTSSNGKVQLQKF